MPYEVNGLADIVKNPTYSTGVGLLLYGLKQHQEKHGGNSNKDSGSNVFEKMKKFFGGDE